MRKLMLGAVMALVLPAAALAQEGTPSPTALATKACKTEKSEMGTKMFKPTYARQEHREGDEGLPREAGRGRRDRAQERRQECKAEREADAGAFADWGTNENGRNAYGKCVSCKAKAASEEETADRVSAADTCKTHEAGRRAAFKTAFGDKRNAFGKCVSKTARSSGERGAGVTSHRGSDAEGRRLGRAAPLSSLNGALGYAPHRDPAGRPDDVSAACSALLKGHPPDAPLPLDNPRSAGRPAA